VGKIRLAFAAASLNAIKN
jgi:hypothetical protein